MRVFLYLCLIFSSYLFSCANADMRSKIGSEDTTKINRAEDNAPVKGCIATAKRHQTCNFYAFDINTNIYIGNSIEDLDIIDDITGVETALSPDGKIVAYASKNVKPGSVYLYDIKNKCNRHLDFPISDEISKPFFAPQGDFLAVSALSPDTQLPKILLYDLRKDTFKIVGRENMGGFNPTFSPNGKKIVFHDMEKVYIYDYNGNTCVKLSKTIPCGEFCPQDKMGISSVCKFQLSSDEKYMYYTYDYWDSDTVRSIAFACYDISSGKIEYLSKKEKSCCDFHASDDGNVYFLLQDSLNCFLYLTENGSKKSSKVFGKNFETPCSFSISY